MLTTPLFPVIQNVFIGTFIFKTAPENPELEQLLAVFLEHITTNEILVF